MATVTRDTVAALARVSSATVSRVMNGVPTVDDELCRRVRQAAATLGYRPSKSASALRRRSTGVVLLVDAKDPQGSAIHTYSQVYVDALLGVQDILGNTHLTLGVHRVSSPAALAELVAEHPCDGVIGYDLDDVEMVAALAELPVRSVAVIRWRLSAVPMVPMVCLDSRAGGRLAAEHLLAAGCRRPLLLGSNCQVPFYEDRRAGFVEAMVAAGPAVRRADATGVGFAFGYASGGELAAAIRAGDIDGVFGDSSWNLVGFVQAALAAGVRIPQELKVVGYDRIDIYQALGVPVAAVDANIRPAFNLATERLLSMLNGEPAVPLTIVEPKLVVPPGA